MSSLGIGQETISPAEQRLNANLVQPEESVLIHSVLSGGGEMGALMRAFDWSQTPLGPLSQWPQSLRIAVRILLGTGYPMLICWGSPYTMIYNDGYRPILGKSKHPAALGSPISHVFAEAMDFIGPRFNNVMARGEDFTVTDQLFILDRNDYLEECYFTFSYSPAPADDGSVGGVLVTALETTERILDDRRRRTLRELATEMAGARSEQEVWRAAAATLAAEPLTTPFAILYSHCPAEQQARLVASAGGTIAAMTPAVVDLDNTSIWPFALALANSAELMVHDLEPRFADAPPTSWGVPPKKAIIVPICLREHREPAGFLVAGISPRREFDARYREFLERSAEQIATGLTSARTYEEERRRSEALAELDRAKTLFFSNVSHEFRTPLTLMLGPLEELWAKATTRDPEERQQLDLTRRNALRLLKLVNTLLEFSRIEAGRVQAVYEPTDLGTLTTEIASSFRSVMEKAGLRFSVNCEPIDEPVYVDRDMWEKIVLNLLSNAFKFTFVGEVLVTLKPVNHCVALSVQDTGVGIEKEEQPRIFERFHRVESARARTYEGTGIGLALVQELVKLHGGNVHVESDLERGSTFTVVIPRGTSHLPAECVGAVRSLASTALPAEAYLQEAERWLPPESVVTNEEPTVSLVSSAATTPSAISDKEHIVVADDNADMRDYLAHLLNEHYAVHAVADGLQALHAVRELSPVLVLADIMMPLLDGFGLVNAIRSDASLSGTPVILLSARAGEESRVEGLQLGADDYLVKPFTARELIARVTTHVKMAKSRREAAQRESRLRAEAERERRRLEELLAQAPAAIALLTGPDHRWNYVNDNYIRLTGRTSESDFIGKTLVESLPELETQGFAALLDEVYLTGKPYFGSEMKAILNRSARGMPDESYWDFVYQPVRDVDGQVEGILVHAVEVTDRVTARISTQENAERLLLAQTAAQVGTWEWDPARDFRHLSPELHRLFGTEAEDQDRAEKWAERVHPEDWDHVQRSMEEATRTGEMDFEYRYQHPEFGLRWFYCKGRRFTGKSRMFGIIQDITERKRVEDTLHANEQRIKDDLEAMRLLHEVGSLCAKAGNDFNECIQKFLEVAIALTKAHKGNLQLRDPNSGALKIVAHQGFAQPFLDFFATVVCDEGAACGRALREGERIVVEDVTKSEIFKGRDSLPVLVAAGVHALQSTPFVSTSGTVLGMISTHFTHPHRASERELRLLDLLARQAADYIERKHAERLLRESEERFRAIIETTPECVKLVNPDGTLQQMNSAGLEMIGADCAETVVGRNIYDLIAPEDRVRFRDFHYRICQGERGSLEFDIVGLKGARRHMESHAAPLRNPDGSIVHLAVARDVTERRLKEQILRESEQRLRVVTDATPVMIWMAGTDKLCYYFNKSWLDFVGRTLQEEIGNGWAENVHPDDFDRCLQIYETSFEARQPFEMEYRIRHRSGEYRWILDHGVPRYTPNGVFEGYVGGCLDIHDQREAADKIRAAGEEVRRHKELLDLALAASDTGTFRWIPNTNKVDVDESLKRLLQEESLKSVENLDDFVRRVHPEDAARFASAIDACRSGADLDMEFRVSLPSGDFRWLYGRAKLRYEQGQPDCFFGACTDVTSRKLAEHAQRHLAAIVESSDDAIVSKDLTGIVKSWNGQAERLFGYSASEMIGQPIRKLIPQELQDDEDRILATIARGDRIEHFETVRVTKDGRRIDVSLTISPIRDENGQIIGASKIARDITRRKQTEQALRITERLASVGRLAATVAHEINNPLEAATNLVYLARITNDGTQTPSLLMKAEEELNRVAIISKQTLGFYRERNGAKAIRLGNIVDSLIAVFVLKAKNKAAEFVSEIRQDPEIYAIEGEIRQLIANLLNNSIDALFEGGKIRVRLSAGRGWRSTLSRGVRLTIADSGRGIAPEDRLKLFEPFFTKNKDVGTGLGLWISKSIVEKHHGSIRFKTRTAPGKSGTTFTVFLPSGAMPQSIES